MKRNVYCTNSKQFIFRETRTRHLLTNTCLPFNDVTNVNDLSLLSLLLYYFSVTYIDCFIYIYSIVTISFILFTHQSLVAVRLASALGPSKHRRRQTIWAKPQIQLTDLSRTSIEQYSISNCPSLADYVRYDFPLESRAAEGYLNCTDLSDGMSHNRPVSSPCIRAAS